MTTTTLWLNSRGDEVRRLHEDLRGLNYTLPEAEVAEGVFGSGTRAAVRDVQALADLEPTGVFDPDAQQALVRARDAAAYETPRVEGQLRTELAAAAGGAGLRLYRYGADGEAAHVGDATTDAEGYFRVDYNADQDPAAAIELRVVTQDGTEISLSQPLAAPTRHHVLNLVAPATAVPAASELERLSADVERSLGGFAPLVRAVNGPADGERPNGNDPLAAAHRATGWDARVLAMAGAAAGLADTTGLDRRGTYALVRQGLPADADQLAALGADTVRAALTRAAAAGLVQMGQDEIRVFAHEFTGFADRTRLASRPAGALSTYGDLLDNSGLGDVQRAAFDRAVVEHAGDPVRLWDAARSAGIGEPEITQLQTQGKLALLTTQNQPLAAKVMDEVLTNGGGRPDLRELVSADLHDAAQWRTRLTELAGGDGDALAAVIPPGFLDGLKARDAADLYASELARRVRLGFPTAVVGRLVRTGTMELGSGLSALATPVAEVIGKAEDLGFSFSSTPLGPFLLDHAAEITAGLDEPTATAALDQFQRLQRLYQVTPSNDALAALAKQGVGSALDIAILGKREFIERFGRHFQRDDELELVHRRARQVAAVTYGFFGISKDAGAPGTSVTSLPADRRAEVVAALVKKFPTVEELFGEQDFCACTHCRSVLSPAAYFVDLLHFLDPNGVAGPRPFDALTKRRPDLEHLPLTCENTNTSLPMLDVANEIMEYRVAHDRLDQGASRDTGSMVTADLLAEPQYLLGAAYDLLRDARYPLSLPFDLWRETVHSLLTRAEVDPTELLDAFRRSDELLPAPRRLPPPGQPPPLPQPQDFWYRRVAVFFSQLGLSAAEATILTDPEPDSWFRLYGYETVQEARTGLRSAKTLARRLGVTYVELVELVKTWFINPDLDTVATLRTIGLDVLDVLRFHEAAGVAPFTELERGAVTGKLDASTKAFGRDDFDAAEWLDDAWHNKRFDNVLLLADDDPGCSFEGTTLRFAGTVPPADPATDSSLDTVLLRLNLLVRLWRALDWRLPDLDLALSALLPGARDGLAAPGLGVALRTALLYLAHLQDIAGRFGPRIRHRGDLVTLWGPMPTRGPQSTYARLFLSPRPGAPDPVFDHPSGDYLTGGETLADHQAAVQAALSMSAGEISAVCNALGTTPESAPLNLQTASLLYRHVLLARALNLPIVELLALAETAGVDPVHALYADPTQPGRTWPLPTGPRRYEVWCGSCPSGPAIIAGAARSSGVAWFVASCTGGAAGPVPPAVMSFIPGGQGAGLMLVGGGLLFHRFRGLPLTAPVAWRARRGCNGSATCEVWEVPAMFEHTFIGLDVHAVNVVGHALNPATGEISTHTMTADPAVVLEWVRRFEPPVKVVYESGPTGFVLARYLQAAGINCVIAASSKLLRAAGDRVKTDRRDARVLAEMLAVGSVTEVRVPDPEEEALRDLSRLRSGTAKDLAHARQHVNAILLRHGIRYPKDTKWTKEHRLWLHRQHFDELTLQFTYQADVEQAELLAGHLARIDKQVATTAAACRYSPVIEALMCLRGIQLTTAFGLAVEIGDWTRFTGSSIGSYLGLVPSEDSSGPSRRQGPITKAGNTYARKLLIEAAWQHRRPYARPGERLLRQLDLVASATRVRALEGNHRLHHKWENFDDRRKMSVKANTAIARELAGWCWSLAAPLQRGERMNAA